MTCEPEIVRIFAGSAISCEPDSLVGDKSGLRIDFSGHNNLKRHISLSSCDKPSGIQVKMNVERVKFYGRVCRRLRRQ